MIVRHCSTIFWSFFYWYINVQNENTRFIKTRSLSDIIYMSETRYGYKLLFACIYCICHPVIHRELQNVVYMKKNRCSRKRGEGPVNKYLWFVIVLISIFLFIKATNSFTFATMAWLTVTEYQMLQMTTDIGSFPHSWLINGFVTRVTRRVSFVEQELLIPVQSTWIRPPVFSSLIFNFPFSVL
jgi:hypothetical protein